MYFSRDPLQSSGLEEVMLMNDLAVYVQMLYVDYSPSILKNVFIYDCIEVNRLML